jgi:hypothetical protein
MTLEWAKNDKVEDGDGSSYYFLRLLLIHTEFISSLLLNTKSL